jgi:hypothetical protein
MDVGEFHLPKRLPAPRTLKDLVACRCSVKTSNEMSKRAMRDETERLVKEALERKTLLPPASRQMRRPISGSGQKTTAR